MKQINKLKSFIVAGLLLVGAAYYASAISQVFTVTNGTTLQLITGSARVTQVVAVSQAGVTNIASFQLVDAPTTNLLFTNLPYTNILSFGTNSTNSWTNYYGATNFVTNINLIDITNTNAGTTNNFSVRISGIAPTNGGSLKFDNVNYYFFDGVVATNLGAGNVTLTITYQQ